MPELPYKTYRAIMNMSHMLIEDKKYLAMLLADKHIDDDIKWFAIDAFNNILAFKTKPVIDTKNDTWKSTNNTQLVYYGRMILSKSKDNNWKKTLIHIDELNCETETVEWDRKINHDINDSLENVWCYIKKMLQTVSKGKTVYLCCKYGDVLKGYIPFINDHSFDFTTDNGEMHTFYYSNMNLSHSPFYTSDSGDLYISMDIKLKQNG